MSEKTRNWSRSRSEQEREEELERGSKAVPEREAKKRGKKKIRRKRSTTNHATGQT